MIYRCSHCGCDEPILGIDGKLYCDNCGMCLESTLPSHAQAAKLEGGPTMAENKMAQVAALFGKKLGERFCIIRYGKRYDVRFLERGFEVYGLENPYVDMDSFVLMDLLNGDAEIMEE
jgi:hypothetical protein